VGAGGWCDIATIRGYALFGIQRRPCMLGQEKCLELLEAALGACACDQAEMVLYVTDESLTVHDGDSPERGGADAMAPVRAITGKASA
jgi:hypothetical protein